jgi:hypothetical protein
MTARLAMRRQDCRSRTPWRPAGHDRRRRESSVRIRRPEVPFHAFPKSSSPQDSSRFDATRVNSRGTPCCRLDRVFARSLRACATARQSSLLVGVRSVGAGPCLAVGTTTDLFFAGFAATSEVASTHSEPKAARRWSVFAKRESCGTFVTLKSGRLRQL